jgi:hypothetical protein
LGSLDLHTLLVGLPQEFRLAGHCHQVVVVAQRCHQEAVADWGHLHCCAWAFQWQSICPCIRFHSSWQDCCRVLVSQSCNLDLHMVHLQQLVVDQVVVVVQTDFWVALLLHLALEIQQPSMQHSILVHSNCRLCFHEAVYLSCSLDSHIVEVHQWVVPVVVQKVLSVPILQRCLEILLLPIDPCSTFRSTSRACFHEVVYH